MSDASARPSGSRLFRFVVVADTHVNEDDDTCTSPYETNRLANVRARHVFQEIAAMQPPPAFVVHLGDIVHPVPSLPAFDEAVAIFKEIAEPVSVPVHLIPGNHDVGDKRIDWMPADQVCDDYLKSYRAAFGDDFYAFDQGPVRFVMLNSLLLNSGLADEARQREWLEAEVAQAGGRRVFLFMHYPPYIYSSDEPGNYDNIDEPARAWLLSMASKPQVEALFAGHVHNFWYDAIGDAEVYMLPSTAFVRHDFTEFYRIAPEVEFGRGDVDKFGYFVVDVHESGHVAYSVRTMGGRAARGEQSQVRPERLLAHPKTSAFTQVGVELRHPWTEAMQVSATGGVQEFGRKWARNDYPLLALFEMGIRLTKVPDVDLSEAASRERMRLMARLGTRYVVTALGKPRPALLGHDLRAAGVAAFEMNLTLERFEEQRALFAALREAHDVELYFSKILTYDDSHFDGKTFSHFVKAGFAPEELAQHRALIGDACREGQIDGVTVRVDIDVALPETAALLGAFADDMDCKVLASLKLAGSGLATARDDDTQTVARAAAAMILSRTHPRVHYIFDTFMDVDRGYYPRHAFIDRRYTPRPAAQAFAALTATFPGEQRFELQEQSAEALTFEAAGRRWQLLSDTAPVVRARLQDLGDLEALDLVRDVRLGAAAMSRSLGEENDEDTQVVLLSLR